MHSRFICLFIPALLISSCSCSRSSWFSFDDSSSSSDSSSSGPQPTSTYTSSTSEESYSSSSSSTSEEPPKQTDFEYELEVYKDVTYAKITKVKLDTSITELTIPQYLDGYPVGVASQNILKDFTSLEKLTTSCVNTAFGTLSYFYTIFGGSANIPTSLTELVIDSPNLYQCVISYFNNVEKLTFKNVDAIVNVQHFPALKSVTLENVTSLNDSFLQNTHALEEIHVSGGNITLDDKGDLYDSEMKTLYRAMSPISEHTYVAPETLTTVCSYAFQNCQEVTDINLGHNCKNVSYSAFSECSSLQRLTLSNANNTLSSMFSGIPSTLTEVTVLGGNKICAYFFSYISTIPTLNLPETITTVESYAFYNCTSLSSIYLPNVYSLGTSAFKGCTATVYYFSQYGNYSEGVFEDSSITSFTFPSSITYIKKNFFKNCTNLTNVTLPSSLTTIDEGAFEGCTKLGSISFNSCVDIGKNAFKGCTSLATITFPSNLKTIGESAFEGCTNLHQVNFSNSSVSLDKNAFYGCTSLTSISNTTNITSLGRYCFSHTTNAFTEVYFPNAMIGLYAFQGWSYLSSLTLGSVANNVTVPELFSNESFTNTYAVSYKVSGVTYTYYVPNSLKTLTICKESSISSRYACNMSKLETLNLPETVKTICSYAFSGCSGIKSLYLPDSITEIQSYAFTSLDNCESVNSDPDYAINTANRSITIQQTAFSFKKLKWFVVPSGKFAVFAPGAIYIPQEASITPVFYTAIKPFYYPWTDGAEQWLNPSGTYKVYPYYSYGHPTLNGYWHYVNGAPTPW